MVRHELQIIIYIASNYTRLFEMSFIWCYISRHWTDHKHIFEFLVLQRIFVNFGFKHFLLVCISEFRLHDKVILVKRYFSVVRFTNVGYLVIFLVYTFQFHPRMHFRIIKSCHHIFIDHVHRGRGIEYKFSIHFTIYNRVWQFRCHLTSQECMVVHSHVLVTNLFTWGYMLYSPITQSASFTEFGLFEAHVYAVNAVHLRFEVHQLSLEAWGVWKVRLEVVS